MSYIEKISETKCRQQCCHKRRRKKQGMEAKCANGSDLSLSQLNALHCMQTAIIQ